MAVKALSMNDVKILERTNVTLSLLNLAKPLPLIKSLLIENIDIQNLN